MESSQSKKTKLFIEKARKIHADRYDYSFVDYTGVFNHVKIKCPIHDIFEQLPSVHIGGCGCSKCGVLRTSEKKRKPFVEYIQRCNEIHDYKYDYSLVEYKDMNSKVIIKCSQHGEFKQAFCNHLSGHGCVKCAFEKNSELRSKTTEEFIKEANIIHKCKYDYSKTEYKGAEIKVIIGCILHGYFEQTPSSHTNGKKGCPKCKRGKLENEWLDYSNIPDIYGITRQVRTKINNKLYIFDGFDQLTNTVYEFNGDRHHGNPLKYLSTDISPICKISYGILYEKTLIKKQDIINEGYNLVEIWESDWKEFKKSIKYKKDR